MQGAGWIPLLRKLPVALHDGLILVTSNSAEIVVQAIVRAERDYLVIRGRMSGSTDAGRVLIVPFDQINYVAVTKRVLEADLQTILNTPGGSVPAPAPAAAADAGHPAHAAVDDFQPFVPERPPEEAAPVEAPPELGHDAASPAGKGPPKPAAPSKSILLARLRARLSGDPGQPIDG